jgi:hypothetical protein
MTAKEKADNLCTRFIYRTTEYISLNDAKQCALIAVDEILEECVLERDWYWEKVKQEIKNI